MTTTAKIITGTITVCLCVAMVLSWRDRTNTAILFMLLGGFWRIIGVCIICQPMSPIIPWLISNRWKEAPQARHGSLWHS